MLKRYPLTALLRMINLELSTLLAVHTRHTATCSESVTGISLTIPVTTKLVMFSSPTSAAQPQTAFASPALTRSSTAARSQQSRSTASRAAKPSSYGSKCPREERRNNLCDFLYLFIQFMQWRGRGERERRGSKRDCANSAPNQSTAARVLTDCVVVLYHCTNTYSSRLHLVL